jgi:hypothetical protein
MALHPRNGSCTAVTPKSLRPAIRDPSFLNRSCHLSVRGVNKRMNEPMFSMTEPMSLPFARLHRGPSVPTVPCSHCWPLWVYCSSRCADNSRGRVSAPVRILRLNHEERRLKRANGLRTPPIISSAPLWCLCLLRWLCNRPFRRPFHTCLCTEWAITSWPWSFL